jgi:hypothetical protein
VAVHAVAVHRVAAWAELAGAVPATERHLAHPQNGGSLSDVKKSPGLLGRGSAWHENLIQPWTAARQVEYRPRAIVDLSVSERGVCTKFITPALEKAGWDVKSQIRAPHSAMNGIPLRVTY